MDSEEQTVYPKEFEQDVPIRQNSAKKFSCKTCKKGGGQYQSLQGMEQHMKKDHKLCFCDIDIDALYISL